jgi:uncharacterized protein YhbP (UPF0306 family)
MSAETERRIAAFLDAQHVLSLATCGPDGPHAANLLYVRDGHTLLWMSDPGSRHSAALETDARAAATVTCDRFDFDDIRGVQLRGHARAITDASERGKARQLLEVRYPRLQQASIDPVMREACARAQLYRLVPERMVLIDNRRGFAHKDAVEIAGGVHG